MKKILYVSFIILGLSISNAGGQVSLDMIEKLIPLHEVKKLPGPYDWMAQHPEKGQTFSDYIDANVIRADEKRKFIYITLLGDFDEKRKEIIAQSARYIEAFFGLEVRFGTPISLSNIDKKARREHPKTGDRQVLTRYILDKILIPNLPDDAFCSIVFTTSDLWPGPGWNFVFGEASIADRVGVWSIYRNGDPNESEDTYKLCLKRTIKTGVHEISHILSMHHCIYYECLMNGSNHRMESDQRPLYLCPVCLKKLLWNRNLNVVQRYKKLMNLSEEFGFKEEKDFFSKSLEALKE